MILPRDPARLLHRAAVQRGAAVLAVVAFTAAAGHAQPGQVASRASAGQPVPVASEPKPATGAAKTDRSSRSRVVLRDVDLRYCLDRGSNEAIIMCAEAGR